MTIAQKFREVVHGRLLAVLIVGTCSLAGRLCLLPWVPVPKPAIQDEFAYLFAGQTFAHGRLTNPTHPMWVHFETVHILSRPTTMAKFPPAMAGVLAFGQVLGHPWIGVLLSSAVMCALICWALEGWLPPAWAFGGGMLAVLSLGTLSYWTDSYWGGTVAASGGALVVGAVPRLRRRAATGTAVAFAAGLAILANSRPYEGMVLGLAASVAIIMGLVRQVRRRRAAALEVLARVALPSALVFLVAGTWMAYYNYRVTGDPMTFPYQVYQRQYAVWSQFLWQRQPLPEPGYNHDAIRKEFIDFHANLQQKLLRSNILLVHSLDAARLAGFYLAPPLTLCCFLGLKGMLRNPRSRMALALLVFFYLGVAVETNLVEHYVAPATALIFLVAAYALRTVKRWFKTGAGRVAWALLLPLAISPLAIRLLRPAAGSLFDKREFLVKRERVLHRLQREPGRHLVLCSYGPHHDLNEEWVYNDADLDHSPIVWAHSMTPDKDRELVRYYPDRRAWILSEDANLTLEPRKAEDPW